MKTEEIKAHITTFLNELHVDIKNLSVELRDNSPYIDLETLDQELFMDNDKDLLRATENVLSQILSRQFEHYVRVTLDVNGQKRKEVALIEDEARKAAKEAELSKREIKMRPMNPYERLLVHSALSDNTSIETESVGVDIERCVIVRYKD